MAIFDELKSIGKVLQEAGKIEQYQQILEAQKRLLEMQKELNNSEEKIKNLEEKLRIKESLFYENNCYWVKKDNDQREGPFCSRCWDKNKDTIRMHPLGNPAYGECPECKNRVITTRRNPDPPHAPRARTSYL
ncbi:MAG TPA: hypothetical protein ENI19_00785 [Candidatus Nealsonbacteria bacterium]|uniref:Uncharacterized protein n=1 Tax=marine sediment metagenome TaxID=412755 RepID=A0A0F9XXL6_9ZZZZ|nr:hypothetical protein [Candidatus Nealsonbacteria bacterium]HEB46228.1 hypothetical protein [Candidatus Nealsonbacteria bacterium]